MRHWIIGIFLLLSVSASAQALRLEASVDDNQVEKSTVFKVTYTIEDIASDFSSPEFKSFDVVAGPSTSTSRSFVNGVRSSSTSYAITLLAKEEGTFTLPPAEVVVDGKTYTSNPVVIKVTKGKTLEEIAGSGRTFIRMKISDTVAYPGQRIRLDYLLYTKDDITGISFHSQDDFNGFHQETNKVNRGYKKVKVGNEPYYVRELFSYNLFPQKTGKFGIAPYTITVSKPINRNSRSFFVRTKSETITSNKLDVVIKALPAGAPVTFSGAVGKFAMNAELNGYEGKVGEASVLTMAIEGTGDQKFWDAPTQKPVEGIEYYDPKIIDERKTNSKWGPSTYKRIEYLLVPEKEGNIIIRPEFTYFDTDSLDYITLDAGPFNLSVKAGSVSDIETDLGKEIESINDAPSERSFNWWMLIPVLLLLGGLGYWFTRKQEEPIAKTAEEIERERKARAEKIALEALSTAQKHADEGAEGKFYTELSLALNRYLGDKYDILSRDRNQDYITEILEQNHVGSDKIEEYIAIMKKCELSLYAKQSQADMKETYHRASTLIQSMVA